MKRFFLLLSAILLLAGFTTESPAQGKKSYSGFKVKSYTQPYKNYKSSSNKSFIIKPQTNSFKKSTFSTSTTKYNWGETYKTSGLPKVKRSNSAKNEFLKSRGYKKVPTGYEVDHIIPLSKGGQDTPANMQLLPKELHKQKTARERKKY